MDTPKPPVELCSHTPVLGSTSVSVRWDWGGCKGGRWYSGDLRIRYLEVYTREKHPSRFMSKRNAMMLLLAKTYPPPPGGGDARGSCRAAACPCPSSAISRCQGHQSLARGRSRKLHVAVTTWLAKAKHAKTAPRVKTGGCIIRSTPPTTSSLPGNCPRNWQELISLCSFNAKIELRIPFPSSILFPLQQPHHSRQHASGSAHSLSTSDVVPLSSDLLPVTSFAAPRVTRAPRCRAGFVALRRTLIFHAQQNLHGSTAPAGVLDDPTTDGGETGGGRTGRWSDLGHVGIPGTRFWTVCL